MSSSLFPTRELSHKAALVTATGKLRGSFARSLGAHLGKLAEEGYERVVIDLQELTSLDSLGTYALEAALDGGLRLHLVVRPAFAFDEFFHSRSLGRRGLRIHRSLDEALSRVREIVDSGMALVG